MSITKNHQSPQTLHQLCAHAFPDRTAAGITELTEGMFNAAYRVDFTDGSSSVLKISAADDSGYLSNEINLMQAEVTAMQIAREHQLPFVPEMQYADFSRTLCSGSYFFMTCLPGRSLAACRSDLTDETAARICTQAGEFQRRMTAIRSDSFGLLGDTKRFSCLFDLLHFMFENVLHDARARSIRLPMHSDELFARLNADRPVFDAVRVPSLVHWDMWEGNLFVADGELCGVIDWERAMWADPFMDDRFRRHSRSAAFLAGYGQAVFSPEEQRRLAWYDVFLYITMTVESVYRQYSDTDALNAWLQPLLAAAWAEVQGS